MVFDPPSPSAMPMMKRFKSAFFTAFCVTWRDCLAYLQLTYCASIIQIYTQMCKPDSFSGFIAAGADWAGEAED